MLKWNNAEWSGVIRGPAVFSKCQHSVNITDNTVYKAFAFKYMMLVVTYSNPVKTLILKNKAKLKEMQWSVHKRLRGRTRPKSVFSDSFLLYNTVGNSGVDNSELNYIWLWSMFLGSHLFVIHNTASQQQPWNKNKTSLGSGKQVS